ncbi:MAG: hypothetical protein KDA32_12220, partial [Phycisphaerales bacterium]|nr:hypothetical protein [Phycisphaerales bacterium]
MSTGPKSGATNGFGWIMRLKLPYAPKIPRIRHRGLLVAASLGLQILILAAVWLLTFRGVRHSLTQSVRDYVVRENAKLVDRLALEFPDDGVEPRYGTPEWDQWQHIIETTGVSLAAGGFACLLDEDGNILCHPDMRHDQSLRKVNLGGDLLRTSSADRTLREIGDSETISGEMSFLAEGTHYVATRRIPGTRYLLLMHQPEASLARAGNDITTNVVGSGLIAISAVLLLSGGGLWTLVRRYDSVFEELNRRMKGDLQIARQIQQATIPSELPAAPGFEIAGWSEPAEETGGDTFDVIGLNRS